MSSDMTRAAAAVEGWFTTDERPHLVGTKCTACGTVVFPPATAFCRNPLCRGRGSDEVALSRTGTVWSYTDAQYRPPPPYQALREPYEPFALAAVELEAEQLVILGQVAAGYGVDDLQIGTRVELVVEPLYEIEGVPHLIYRWKPMPEGEQ